MIERYRDGVVPERRAGPGAARRVRRPRRARSRRASTRVELTAALDEIWQRIKRLNRYVQDEEPWQLAKDEAAGRAPRPGALHARRGPARGVGAAPPVHARTRPSGCSRARSRGPIAGRRALGRGRRRRQGRRARPALPAGRGRRRSPPEAEPVVDTHCHLDYCEPPDGELVERARAAGVTPDRHRRDERRRRSSAALRGRRASTTRWSRSSAATRTRPPASTSRRPRGDRARRARTRGCARSARPASTTTATTRPRDDQRRAFEAQLELAARARPAGRDPHARGRGRHLRDPARARRSAAGGDPPLLLRARPARGVRRARLPVLVRRQRDLPEGDRPPARRARRCPTSCCWSRPTRPYLAPQPVRGKPNEPANVTHTARFVAELRGVDYERARARPSSDNAARRLRLVTRRAAPGEPPAPARVRRPARTASSARTS